MTNSSKFSIYFPSRSNPATDRLKTWKLSSRRKWRKRVWSGWPLSGVLLWPSEVSSDWESRWQNRPEIKEEKSHTHTWNIIRLDHMEKFRWNLFAKENSYFVDLANKRQIKLFLECKCRPPSPLYINCCDTWTIKWCRFLLDPKFSVYFTIDLQVVSKESIPLEWFGWLVMDSYFKRELYWICLW